MLVTLNPILTLSCWISPKSRFSISLKECCIVDCVGSCRNFPESMFFISSNEFCIVDFVDKCRISPETQPFISSKEGCIVDCVANCWISPENQLFILSKEGFILDWIEACPADKSTREWWFMDEIRLYCVRDHHITVIYLGFTHIEIICSRISSSDSADCASRRKRCALLLSRVAHCNLFRMLPAD